MGRREVVGDATRPRLAGPVVIAHVVNDQGAWGRGFVVAVSERWPGPERAYRRWYRDGRLADGTPFELGQVQLLTVASDADAPWWVANLLAQRGLGRARSPLDLSALTASLDRLARFAYRQQATVVCPPVGTGLGGARWDDVAAVLDATLVARGIDVVVHRLPGQR